ncbi:hypothetical protein FACS189472_13210 [Alphaproteobacteria bacterium]|nr:hypothetical protein FACS189472_13210 [Alphaproteobacteria bacterium]
MRAGVEVRAGAGAGAVLGVWGVSIWMAVEEKTVVMGGCQREKKEG